MFYSQYVLSKKGALSRVWLSAHWENKLTKVQILDADVTKSVESIQNPNVPFALRMSGHLLLGVVRIYSRKAKYLLSDAQDALVKIKMAFKTGERVDLPENATVAKFTAITMPEADPQELEMSLLDDFELDALPEFDNVVDFNKARRGEITMTSTDDSMERGRGDEEDADGFPNAFGADLDGQTPEALRAATPLGTGGGVAADFLADGDMQAFGVDDAFDQSGFDQGGFDAVDDDQFPVTPMDAALDSRRATLSTALGPRGMELLDLKPGDFTPGGAAALPDSAGGAAALVTPTAGFELLDDDTDNNNNNNAVTPAPQDQQQQHQHQQQQQQQRKRRRRMVEREANVELPSPAIHAQLKNTAPTLAKLRTAPGTAAEWRLAIYDSMPVSERVRRAPFDGFSERMHAIVASRIDAALAYDSDGENDDEDDDESQARLAADALGAELADVASGEGEFGAPDAQDDDDFHFDGGFDGYGDDELPSTQQLLDDDFNAEPEGFFAGDDDDADAGALGAPIGDEDGDAMDDDGQSPANKSWSLHTQRMHAFLARCFDEQRTKQLSFQELAEGKKRKTVAATFFELLVLKSKSYIELEQDAPYGDLKIGKAKRFARGAAVQH